MAVVEEDILLRDVEHLYRVGKGTPVRSST